ncbi:MAG: hypothetical protein Q9217_005845 [Psora testacea]
MPLSSRSQKREPKNLMKPSFLSSNMIRTQGTSSEHVTEGQSLAGAEGLSEDGLNDWELAKSNALDLWECAYGKHKLHEDDIDTRLAKIRLQSGPAISSDNAACVINQADAFPFSKGSWRNPGFNAIVFWQVMLLSVPPGHCMIPGKTYVGVLPGHRRPSFVRKRPIPYRDRSSFADILTQIFSHARSALIAARSSTMRSCRRRRYCGSDSDFEYEYYTRRHGYQRRPHAAAPYRVRYERVPTTPQQTCSACGKFRSPSWQARHPVVPGQIPKPALCKACRDKSTSVEDSDYSYRGRRRHRHRQRQYTDSGEGPAHRWSHRYCCSPAQHCHQSPSLAPSRSRDSINILIDNDAGERRARATVRETATPTAEDVRVVREIGPSPRSRSSIVVDGLDDRYPRRGRSSSSVRYVRSHSPRSARFVNELDDLRPPRHRSRSVSRVSFVDEPEEIVLPRPQSHRRRVRVYYDGAGSGQSEAKNMSIARKPHTSVEDDPGNDVELCNGQSNSRQYQSEAHSRVRSPVDEGEDIVSPRSYSRAGHPNESHTWNTALNDGRHSYAHASARSSRLNSAERFVHDDADRYTNGPLWNQPKKHSLPYVSPVKRSRKSKSRTVENVAPPRKRRRCYREPSDLAGSDSKDALPTPQEIGYRHVPAPISQVPQTNAPRGGNRRPPIALTPDHPDHPDHLAYLLSAHHITPVETAPGEWEYYESHNSPLSADYSPPATPIDPNGSYYRSGYNENDEYGRFGYEPRTVSEMDYDEAAYYEAKGREYMQHLTAEKAQREHLDNAYA